MGDSMAGRVLEFHTSVLFYKAILKQGLFKIKLFEIKPESIFGGCACYLKVKWLRNFSRPRFLRLNLRTILKVECAVLKTSLI